MEPSLQHLLRTIVRVKQDEEEKVQEDTIDVSDTVAVAASAYELVRNTLEYDEEHLLRRNAIRRILKRRLAEGADKQLASNLLRELIWARYLPNNSVPERKIEDVQQVLEKYESLVSAIPEDTKEGQARYDWLLDVLSSEIEYLLMPPVIDEALASYAYQELKQRIQWATKVVKEEDRDLQLYVAVHRAILKSNLPTLRYRIFTLFYKEWRTAKAGDVLVQEIEKNLSTIIDSIEHHILHPSADAMFRFVRKHAVVFHLLRDIGQDDPDAFYQAVQAQDVGLLEKAITRAADDRYARFKKKLFRSVVRATVFLFLTKMVLALLIEAPYEMFILHTTDYLPLAVNILFPPFLLAVLGFTVRIPAQKNTEKILEEVRALLGLGDDFALTFKMRRSWQKGALGWIFRALYLAVFLFSVGVISTVLIALEFNSLSIVFFLFFLSLVAFLGLRIRHTKRDLVIVESAGGLFGFLSDILFLPIVRVGRWIALRAPRVNIFLFFFDFIIEAPFKAAIGIIESWLAFLREKKEEIY